jgi:intracellular sulfur oxidation DsrE/DsrF family protein
MIRRILCISILLGLSAPALAGRDDFIAGTAVPDYGVYAPVTGVELPAGTHLKIAFDVSDAGPDDAVNRQFEMVARSVNLHTAKGVSPENLSAAIVVHGIAGADLLTNEARGAENPNAGIIAQLQAAGVTIQLCGQSAEGMDIKEADLLPGITMAPSAITAHALLQQKGYTLNPF